MSPKTLRVATTIVFILSILREWGCSARPGFRTRGPLVQRFARLRRLDDTAGSYEHRRGHTVWVHDAVAPVIVVVGPSAALPTAGDDEHAPPPWTLAFLSIRADLRHNPLSATGRGRRTSCPATETREQNAAGQQPDGHVRLFVHLRA